MFTHPPVGIESRRTSTNNPKNPPQPYQNNDHKAAYAEQSYGKFQHSTKNSPRDCQDRKDKNDIEKSFKLHVRPPQLRE
jgi:hypothetical protein